MFNHLTAKERDHVYSMLGRLIPYKQSWRFCGAFGGMNEVGPPICTREYGHTGYHIAYTTKSEVVSVWEERESMTSREARRKLGSRSMRRAGIRKVRLKSGQYRITGKATVATQVRRLRGRSSL
jgi:hypothetical protein